MAAVFETEEPVTAVHIEGLAALKIVKHCQESLPQMVTGSLLGLTVGNGVLEITHAFPFPEDSNKSGAGVAASVSGVGTSDDAANELARAADAMGGHDFQLEMMKMLREVNVDNNCVGWYQCMYLGSYSTAALVENQLSYQTDLSPNAVVILYDPLRTTHAGRSSLVLRCYRLSRRTVELRTRNANDYVDPSSIFEEIPVTFKNPALVRALLYDVRDGRHGPYDGDDEADGLDCDFDRLDLDTDPYLEKHLEFLCTWVDELAAEQSKFQFYARGLGRKGRGARGSAVESTDDAADGWNSADAPRRMESLLINNQIRSYCDQVDRFAGAGFGKLFVAGGVRKRDATTSTSGEEKTP